MLWVGLLLLVAIGVQWLTQEITLKFLGAFGVSYHREEFPGLYWSVILLEFILSVLFIYWHFS